MIWGAEIEWNAPPLFDFGVTVELGAVVSGEGLEEAWCLADQPVQSGIETFHFTVVQLTNQSEAGGALDQRDDAMRRALSGNRVDLPVAEFMAILNVIGPLRNVPLA